MKEKVKAFISENGINKSNKKKISDVEIDKFRKFFLLQGEETLQK